MNRTDSSRDVPLSPILYRIAIGVTFLLLVGTAVFVYLEHSLPGPRWFEDKQTVFIAGSIGTEFIPLPVLEVLPDIDPERFPPPRVEKETGILAGGWIERYGFLERRIGERTVPATNPELGALLEEDRELRALPVGFTLSHYRPFGPDPSPVRFVGLACAGCHSARLPDRGPEATLVYGAGNTGLDLIGFFQAFRGVLLARKVKPSVPEARRKPVSVTEGPNLDDSDYEYALSLSSVQKARRKRGLRALTRPEQLMIWFWLQGAQSAAEHTKMKYDLPPTPEQLRTAAYNPVGPGRTEPFVTLDNTVLNLPASHNRGFSKIPAVFREKDRLWAQFDGSVKLPNTRSGLAAMTAGGSVHNLGGLGIGRNIIDAADYTVEVLVGPKWADIFGKPPAEPSTEAAESGDVEATSLSDAQRRGRAATGSGAPDATASPTRLTPVSGRRRRRNSAGSSRRSTPSSTPEIAGQPTGSSSRTTRRGRTRQLTPSGSPSATPRSCPTSCSPISTAITRSRRPGSTTRSTTRCTPPGRRSATPGATSTRRSTRSSPALRTCTTPACRPSRSS